jgi:hypothetical protein
MTGSRGKPYNLDKNLQQCHFVHHEYHMKLRPLALYVSEVGSSPVFRRFAVIVLTDVILLFYIGSDSWGRIRDLLNTRLYLLQIQISPFLSSDVSHVELSWPKWKLKKLVGLHQSNAEVCFEQDDYEFKNVFSLYLPCISLSVHHIEKCFR